MSDAVFGSRRSAARKTTLTEAAPDAGQEALRFLASQGLPPTPDNYAFAWQVRIERHGLVAMAVDAILMDGRAVLQDDVARIMTAARPKASAQSDDPQQDALRHQTLKLADLAAGAAASSSLFERDLSNKLHRLDAGPASTQQIVEAMIGRTQAVEAELRSASREIELLRQQVEVVRDDAQRDALTGLLNRRGAMHELSGRSKAYEGVVALCDVDHFKSVNDRFGHGVGDRVLKGVAASLSESCQVHQVIRWGGEEFLVILDGLGMEDARYAMQRACAQLGARTFRVRETDEPIGRISMSIGLASLRGQDVDEAIELADRRLYAAKRAGRDCVVHGDDGTNG